tara:strand:- start:285 stop:926 length:642 start_codon:yes stop_codon:yes gene_type:complete
MESVVYRLLFVNTVAYGKGALFNMKTKTIDLSKTDWIEAGFQALITSGPTAVSVEPLARQLGVTKGSFYWHFKNRTMLHEEMLNHWETVSTERIIELVESTGGTAREKLEQLVGFALHASPGKHGGARAEGVLRAWAASSERARKMLARIDKRRRAYLTKLFKEAGLEVPAARHAADIVYLASIGAQTARSTGHTIDHLSTWDHLLDRLLEQT